MENAAEALKMAAWVLIFVVALSMCISSFTQARQTMDTILSYNDKEYNYTYVEEEEEGTTERIVRCETIIPAIYRAYKENYKIIFPSDYVLYRKRGPDGGTININYIDLEKDSPGGNDTEKEKFIEAILFGKNKNTPQNITANFNFPDKPEDALYEKLKGKKLIEKVGVYYQEEAGDTEESSTPDANKNRKRVITYEEYEEIK